MSSCSPGGGPQLGEDEEVFPVNELLTSNKTQSQPQGGAPQHQGYFRGILFHKEVLHTDHTDELPWQLIPPV